jgi:hypothetical protein
MSKKMMAIYCLFVVLLITLVFSHFVDIPNMKEGFDLVSQINQSVPNSTNDETEEDEILTPSSAPGLSPSSDSSSPSSDSSSPSSEKELLPNYGIPIKPSPKVESFRTRKKNSHIENPKKPKNDSVCNRIFTDNESKFKLKDL